MPSIRIILTLMPLSILGCRPPDIVHRNVPVAPDVAVYGQMCMVSRDGMKRYRQVTVLLTDDSSSTKAIDVVFPDGFSICPADVTLSKLKEHSRECNVSDDDGNGNCSAIADDEIQVVFKSHQAMRVSLSVPTRTLSKYSVQYNGRQFSLPISRSDLESMIGPPDVVKLDTWPGELRSDPP